MHQFKVMNFGRPKSRSMFGIWLIVLLSCPGFAQVKTASSSTNVSVSKRDNLVKSPKQKLLTKVAPPKTSNWFSSLEITQNQSLKNQESPASTYVDITSGFDFDGTYSAGANFSGLQSWDRQQKSSSGSRSFDVNDVYLLLTRTDLITLTSYLGLPVSQVAQDSGRQFSVSLEPSYEWENPRFRFYISSDFIFNHNRPREVNVVEGEEPAETFLEKWAISSKVSLSLRFNKTWSWYNSISYYQSWDPGLALQETASVSTGPQFRLSKKSLFRLAYFTDPSESSDSGISLSAFLDY